MLALVFAFLAGILAIQQFAELPNTGWLIVLLAGVAVLAWLRYWPMAVFLIGMCWAIIFADIRLHERLAEQLAGQDIEVRGYVADLPEDDAKHVRFNFKVSPPVPKVPELLRLSWYYPNQTIKAGQSWQLTVRLKPPHGNFNPGGFDYERWLFVEGIGATGYVRKQQLLTQADSFSVLSWRQNIADKIDRLPIQTDRLAMIKALTIGDGNSLSAEQWDVFRKTGTTHLMVISGSHVALIAGAVYLLILRFYAYLPVFAWSPPKAAALAAIVSACLYAALTGFAVPAQRALLMLSVGMVALMQQRHASPFHALAIALLVVLLVDPLIVLSAGFWLSFLAVSLIIFAIAGRLAKPGMLAATVKINWYSSIGLAPLLLFLFQQVSLIAPVANLIAVPIIGFIMVPVALLGIIILLVAPVFAGPVFSVVEWCLQGLWQILIRLAELPIATFTQIQPNWFALLLAIPGVVLLLAPKGAPSRWLGLVLVLPMLITKPQVIPQGSVKLSLLDVGQGLSAVVQTARHVLVYDTGAKFTESSDAAKSIVMPYLRNQGIDNVGTLIISHGDNDHIGGAKSLLSAFKAGQILTSVPHMLSEYKPITCQAGQGWRWDEVQFSVLSPTSGAFASDNDNSCVLQITSEQDKILLTGDIEADAETRLIKDYGEKLRANVLIAPHHGSNTSSTLLFLQTIKPELILIPAGYRNQFGHPHQEVTQRYHSLNAKWLLNADEGAIKVEASSPLKVESWRKAHGHYWNFQSLTH